jgi:hypothetical protein
MGDPNAFGYVSLYIFSFSVCWQVHVVVLRAKRMYDTFESMKKYQTSSKLKD